MKETIQYFNSQEAAKILGVNVSSIKRWTDEGKLECIKTAGGHRKFMMEHLSHFLEKNKKKTSKVNLFPLEDTTDLKISHYIIRGDFDYLRSYVLKNAVACERNRVQQVLNGLYLGQYPLHQIYDELVTPIMYDVGSYWNQGQMSIAEEHFASQTIRDSIIRLQGIIRVPRKKIGNIICLNLSNELHDIALKMVDHILEARGFQMFYSGQKTLLDDIEKVFKKHKLKRLYISSTVVDDVETFQREFTEICDICKSYKVDVYIGGQGFGLVEVDHPAVVKQLFTFQDVHSY